MTRAGCSLAALATAALLAFAGGALAAGAPAPGFASPEQAIDALVAAVRADDAASIEHVLGRGSKKLVESGDPVADKSDRAQFVASYDEKHVLEPHGDEATLLVGPNGWLFPIPLRNEAHGWRFDPRAGAQQILDRRIGRNELAAIATCRAIVDAEREYATEPRGDGQFTEYAQKFISSRGKQDGLYWHPASGASDSPLGPLVAEARSQGYGGRHSPYHGYYFKILTSQGPNARGGARDYIVRGHMIGGFAVVAYPAKWGDSGVMTFVVNQDGTVYEKNFGRATARIAPRLTSYDPDPSWQLVPEAGAGN